MIKIWKFVWTYNFFYEKHFPGNFLLIRKMHFWQPFWAFFAQVLKKITRGPRTLICSWFFTFCTIFPPRHWGHRCDNAPDFFLSRRPKFVTQFPRIVLNLKKKSKHVCPNVPSTQKMQLWPPQRLVRPELQKLFTRVPKNIIDYELFQFFPSTVSLDAYSPVLKNMPEIFRTWSENFNSNSGDIYE